jgi:hypothetical protein
VEKLNNALSDVVWWMVGLIMAISGFVSKRLFGNIDHAHRRIDALEARTDELATKNDLHTAITSAVQPVQETQQLILSNLLSHRVTEKDED